MKMSKCVSETFARAWIEAWNRSDVEGVLAHYAGDATFVSPLAAAVTGSAEVHGRDALRAYWTKALRSRSSPLQFALESVVWDEKNQALLIVYVSTELERQVRRCELMHFRSDGLIERGEAFVGELHG